MARMKPELFQLSFRMVYVCVCVCVRVRVCVKINHVLLECFMGLGACIFTKAGGGGGGGGQDYFK